MLVDDDPGELADAWAAVSSRGRKWSKGVRDGLAKLDEGVQARVADVIGRA